MKYDSIIFDIDGTLWDTAEAVTKGWNKSLEALDFPERVSGEGINSVFGKPFMECVDILLPGLREKYPELIPEISRQTYKILVSGEGVELYGGVIEGIKKLSAEHKLFLMSNCEEEYLNIFFESTGLRKYFTGWDCHGMSRMSKDKMIAGLKSKHNLERMVYVGDTAGDQKAAELAGVDFIFVSYGFGKAENPTRTFDNFPDLVDYLIVR